MEVIHQNGAKSKWRDFSFCKLKKKPGCVSVQMVGLLQNYSLRMVPTKAKLLQKKNLLDQQMARDLSSLAAHHRLRLCCILPWFRRWQSEWPAWEFSSFSPGLQVPHSQSLYRHWRAAWRKERESVYLVSLSEQLSHLFNNISIQNISTKNITQHQEKKTLREWMGSSKSLMIYQDTLSQQSSSSFITPYYIINTLQPKAEFFLKMHLFLKPVLPYRETFV